MDFPYETPELLVFQPGFFAAGLSPESGDQEGESTSDGGDEGV